jgi:hypothetical protein
MHDEWINGRWTHREYGLIVLWNADTDEYTNITRAGDFVGNQPRVNLSYEPSNDDEFVVYVSHTHPLVSPLSVGGMFACMFGIVVCGSPFPSNADLSILHRYPGAYGEVQSRNGNFYFGPY